jgi:hypothetical protein
MKARLSLCVAIAAFLSLSAATLWAQTMNVPKNLVTFVNTELVRYGADPVIVKAVRDQNASRVSMTRIKAEDEHWINSEEIDGFMFDLMRNRCSHELLNLQVHHGFVVEAFAMDNQGALVGLTNKTSDYWQGDEAKFIESYKNGSGAVHYGDVEFDDSIGEIVVQVSVPVMSGSRAIGAITFGVSLDRWEYR